MYWISRFLINGICSIFSNPHSDRITSIYTVVDLEMDKYDVVKDLGAGNFGVARLLRHKDTKELVAMKYIERGRKVSFFCLFTIWVLQVFNWGLKFYF